MEPMSRDDIERTIAAAREAVQGRDQGQEHPKRERAAREVPLRLIKAVLGAGRDIGDDGPDDVRRHEPLGPRMGSAEAARNIARYEQLREQEEEREWSR